MAREDAANTSSQPRTRGERVRLCLAVFVPTLLVLLAAYLLYAQAQTYREERWPSVEARKANQEAANYAAKGEPKKETERLGKPGSPVVVEAFLPPSPCANPMRGLLRDMAAKYGNKGLHVVIYNSGSPERAQARAERKVKCATLFINGAARPAKHGGDLPGTRAEIEKRLAEAKRGAQPKITPPTINPKKGA